MDRTIAVILFLSMFSVVPAQRKRLDPPPVPVLSAGQKALESDLIGKTVTLAQDLYSISYPGVSPDGRRTAVTQGILALRPGQSPAYRFVEVGPPASDLIDLSDSDPNRLLDKVQGARPPLMAAATKLLKYAAGSKMKVVGFDWGGRLLNIKLDDDSASIGLSTGVAATKVSILWPQIFSADLTERPAIDGEISKAFTR